MNTNLKILYGRKYQSLIAEEKNDTWLELVGAIECVTIRVRVMVIMNNTQPFCPIDT